MIAVRLDRRMAARVDASDIVQEALTEAAGRLSDYVSNRPLPFYPWLRHIAWQHLIKSRQRHIGTQRRSVAREQRAALDFTEHSAAQLADRLVADDTSPSGRAIRGEERERVRAALALLPPRDHEVLVLRHLELLSPAEIAAVLGLTDRCRHDATHPRARAPPRAPGAGPRGGTAVTGDPSEVEAGSPPASARSAACADGGAGLERRA